MAVCLQHSHIFPITLSIPPRLRLLQNGRRASVYCLFLNLTWLTEHNHSWTECKNVTVKIYFSSIIFLKVIQISAFCMIRAFFLSWMRDQMLLPTKFPGEPLFSPSPPCFFHGFRFRPPRHYAGLTNIQRIRGIVSHLELHLCFCVPEKNPLNCDVGVQNVSLFSVSFCFSSQ